MAMTAQSCPGARITPGGSRSLTRLIRPAQCLLCVISRTCVDILRTKATKVGFDSVGMKVMLRKC